MRLIFIYLVVGYLFWKLARYLMRVFNPPAGAPTPQQSPKQDGTASKPQVFREEEIKDAVFEDITPPPGTSSKTSTH
jgi:hypothetical protein